MLIQKKVKFKEYCPKCLIKKPVGSVHCEICDTCVEEFDHHCYWINKCVGKNNHRLFILFLIFNIVDLMTNIALSVVSLVKLSNWSASRVDQPMLLPKEFYSNFTVISATILVILLSLTFILAISFVFN